MIKEYVMDHLYGFLLFLGLIVSFGGVLLLFMIGEDDMVRRYREQRRRDEE